MVISCNAEFHGCSSTLFDRTILNGDFFLEVAPLKGSHKEEFIAKCLSDTMFSFNLRIQKIKLMLRENASNVIKACENIKAPHF